MLEILEILEDDQRTLKIKKVLTTIFILAITFAVPVVSYETLQSHLINVNAQNRASGQPVFQFSLTNAPALKSSFFMTNILLPYWWLFVLTGILVIIWIFLLILFFKHAE